VYVFTGLKFAVDGGQWTVRAYMQDGPVPPKLQGIGSRLNHSLQCSYDGSDPNPLQLQSKPRYSREPTSTSCLPIRRTIAVWVWVSV